MQIYRLKGKKQRVRKAKNNVGERVGKKARVREQGTRTWTASRRQVDRGEGSRGDEGPIREDTDRRVRVRTGRSSLHAAASALAWKEQRGRRKAEESGV